MNYPDEHKIDELQSDIYARDFPNKETPRTELSKENIKVEDHWEHKDLVAASLRDQVQKKPPMSVFKKIFIISLIFFVVSAATALAIFFGGFNIVSPDKVDMTFIGPVSVAAGEEVAFDVVIVNQNSAPLQEAEIYIDFPEGSKRAEDITQDLTYSKEDIGNIPERSSVKRTVRAVLFDKENEIKEVKVTVEYKLKASNASYKKEKIYKVAIGSTPVSLTVNHPPDIASGQDVTLTVDVVSNAAVPLTNLLLKAEYPFGYEFKSADTAPTLDTNIWNIPVLQPGEKKTITIQGRIEGEDGDERIFRFNIGTMSPVNAKQIVTNFLSQSKSIHIRKPPLAILFELAENKQKEIITSPGQNMLGRIVITNNMPVQLINGKIDIQLGGTALDVESPSVTMGLYRTSTKVISWDKTVQPALAMIGPGETVEAFFSLKSLSQAQIAAIKNGTITLDVKVSAVSVGTDQVITNGTTRLVKVQQSMGLLSQLVYSRGPFANTGPIPPKTETPTTYTVIWTITRSSNNIAGAEVRATIPSFVKWLGKVSPTTENITWLPDRNEIVWKAGDIAGGITGQTAKEVAFQIELTPPFSQRGTLPIVMDNITLRGTDTFTQQAVTTSAARMSTTLLSDPAFSEGSGRVE